MAAKGRREIREGEREKIKVVVVETMVKAECVQRGTG
jgi:hypothetical protein